MDYTFEVAGHTCVIDYENRHLIEGRKLHLVRFRSPFSTSHGHVAFRKEGAKWFYLHRVIAETPEGMLTDHIDGDTLNNRKSNLRICTRSQNAANSRVRGDNQVGLKGVRKDKPRKTQTWSARLRKNGKRIDLGRFKSPEEAHAAYCAAALKYHGEFARTA